MTTVLENPQSIRAALESLQVLVEQLRESFVGGIKNPAQYDRACALLDELTDGHALNVYEERVLRDLEEAILEYERNSDQFAAFNADFKANSTPVQLLRDFMETMGLTGSDLPEIGDKTTVSKVLAGTRPISHKMAYALAQRFHTKPDAFIETSIPSGKPKLTVTENKRFKKPFIDPTRRMLKKAAMRGPLILSISEGERLVAVGRPKPAKPTSKRQPKV